MSPPKKRVPSDDGSSNGSANGKLPAVSSPKKRASSANGSSNGTANGQKTNGKKANGKMPAVSPSKESASSANGSSNGSANGNKANGKKRRRATAESMAKAQREISVSEFFAKNKQLLGFDSDRKALLTTVKEAVDNSLDACEEAGIVPEVWVTLQPVGNQRFRVSIQDNGPGILKKQIPLIFGKLLYGSKFHRLRMSRGQQGIGISAAGMNGKITTGKPVKIFSKLSIRKPGHYYEVEIDTKSNKPVILNGRGNGEDIPPGEKGRVIIEKKQLGWESYYPPEEEGKDPKEIRSGTRVTIELRAKHQRGRGSVDEYLEQTAIANPHVTLHYTDPDGQTSTYARSTTELPPEPKEIKPHPYGVELGRLVTMLQDTKATTLSQFLTTSFSRVSPAVARRICEGADLSTRGSTRKVRDTQVDSLYRSIQETKIKAPATDCISPIGEDLLLKGLHQVVPGEFYVAATRPPAVYRGNPFQIEVALAYGGAPAVQKVTADMLDELIGQSDARTLRQFLVNTFDLGQDGSDKIIKEAGFGTRTSPGRMSAEDRRKLHHAMQHVNLSDGQSMQVLRYANRVPLQFKMRDCAITQAIMNTNWRSYGLSQSRGSLPSGPITIMVHVASVWVPFTSESKEAVASFAEIEKELRLGLQAVGRKLGMYMRRRKKVKQEGQRRSVFLRYLGEVAQAVNEINGADKDDLYSQLLRVAQRKTSQADIRFDENGQPIEETDVTAYGDNVLIVDQSLESLASH